jgi:hypothetical protein
MIDQFKELLKSLYPVKTKYELIRVGGDNDGGYLLPNDLSGIATCFSPGVDVTASFEQDLLNRGIRSHLADWSVDAPPAGLEVASFEKKFLSGVNDDQFMTLEFWVRNKGNYLGDFILQMDIEGHEYETILAAPINILRRFRIIAMEIHNAEAWFNNPIAWGCVRTFFGKLLADFHVVHNHPNNNCPFIEVDGILIPTTFELTLLRKDRAAPEGYCTQFPHPLDQPNVLDKPDRPLPPSLYGANDE